MATLHFRALPVSGLFFGNSDAASQKCRNLFQLLSDGVFFTCVLVRLMNNEQVLCEWNAAECHLLLRRPFSYPRSFLKPVKNTSCVLCARRLLVRLSPTHRAGVARGLDAPAEPLRPPMCPSVSADLVLSERPPSAERVNVTCVHKHSGAAARELGTFSPQLYLSVKSVTLSQMVNTACTNRLEKIFFFSFPS